ncbi:MAG: DUF2141 domain-containing protein [Myxococcaceae bacterium]|jgi:uncharacterized protein (DUF2141 family)|nr:DUF2141 domain-containing protein [Myxococcaceae bacterium]MCA3016326.1 DUF2141 domain-containing protein [Myxococcaceae bacterium]
MKPVVAALACLTLTACGGVPSGAPPAPTITLSPGASSLTVRIDKVKSDRGPVFCDLFNAADGFPGPSPIIGGTVELDARDEPVCRWSGLPAGDYAVSVIQDENANGSLDTNVLGVPLEGYGVSNNVVPSTTAPRWSDARLTIDGTQSITITVQLFN